MPRVYYKNQVEQQKWEEEKEFEQDRKQQKEEEFHLDQEQQSLKVQGTSGRNDKLRIMIPVCLVILLAMAWVFVGRQNKIEVKRMSYCEQNRQQCSIVKTEIRDLMISNNLGQDQVRAIIQVAQAIQKITNMSAETDKQQQTLSQLYRELYRAGQCIQYVLGIDAYLEYFSKIISTYLQTQSHYDNYLTVIQSFSGQPLKYKSLPQLYFSCNFNATYYAQLPSNNDFTSENSTRQLATLYFINQFGYSVSGTLQSLVKIAEMTYQLPDMNFQGGVIFLGPWRKQIYLHTNIFQALKSTRNISIGDYQQLVQLYNGNQLAQKKSYGISQIFRQKISADMKNISDNFEIEYHIQMIGQNIREGKKVIILASGEGSKYVQEIMNNLPTQYRENVGWSNIQNTPESEIEQNEFSSDSSNSPDSSDNQSKTEQETLSEPEKAQISKKQASIKSKLNIFKKAIVKNLKDVSEELKTPEVEEGSGVITVEMAWKKQNTDVDLHVIEPDGSHLYFGKKKNNIGFLDVDQTHPVGPQHYYTNSTNLKPGVYEIRANYWKGTGNVTVIFQVSAGPQSIIKQLTFQEIPKKEKDIRKAPYFVCQIQVSQGLRKNKFKFKIIQEQK